MKLLRSSKLDGFVVMSTPILAVLVVLAYIIFVAGASKTEVNNNTTTMPPLQSKIAENQVGIPIVHTNIVTTVFWVGEAATKDNGYIANSVSAWDEQWQSHYGTDAHPKENTFYFALPYNDFNSTGNRKASAQNCANSSNAMLVHTSWCKNTWIKITAKDKVAYAQWQDVGPYEEDDASYVFGKSAPKNTQGEKAGLDISPATQDYLGLQDVDRTSWSFVAAKDVPAGPWLTVITVSTGDQSGN